MNEKITTSLVPYKFEYAMSRLKDAIDYAVQTGDFEGVRLWAMNVEESHNAEVKDMEEAINGMDEGLKLLHSLATGGETSVLSRLDNGVDVQDAVRWQDGLSVEDVKRDYTFSTDNARVINLNGYKATATSSWRERHLNES